MTTSKLWPDAGRSCQGKSSVLRQQAAGAGAAAGAGFRVGGEVALSTAPLAALVGEVPVKQAANRNAPSSAERQERLKNQRVRASIIP
jgi:hypothetical protein